MAVLVASLVVCQAASGQETFSGKVAETMNAGTYTYVLVATGTNKLWAAGPQFAVKVGDTVTVASAMPMDNFHSKTLNRDFPVIYFAGNITVNGGNAGAEKLPPGHPNISGVADGKLPPGHPALPGKAAPAKIDFAGFKPGKDTVASVCGASSKFAGKTVALHAKVVKYNAEILGKNWLHIQDGTGKDGSNDLLVTSTATAKVGDTVLVEGKVALNKDFGSGYKYAVMVEDAKVTVE